MRVLLTLFACISIAARDGAVGEYAAKAAFISKFLGYVKWPESAFENAASPLRVAVLGADPFGKALDDTFKDKRFGTRAIEIVRFKSLGAIEPCHVLFVPNAEAPRLPKLLEELKGRSVLLIGESTDFAATGGCINFVLEDKKIRFELNPDATKRAELEVSSQLMQLAKRVRDAKNEAPR